MSKSIVHAIRKEIFSSGKSHIIPLLEIKQLVPTYIRVDEENGKFLSLDEHHRVVNEIIDIYNLKSTQQIKEEQARIKYEDMINI